MINTSYYYKKIFNNSKKKKTMKQKLIIASVLALIGETSRVKKKEIKSRNEKPIDVIIVEYIEEDYLKALEEKIKNKNLNKDKELATNDLIYFLLKNYEKMEDLKTNIREDEIPIFGEDLYEKYKEKDNKEEIINYDEYIKYYFIDKNKVDQIKEIINKEKRIILTGNKEKDQENLDKIQSYLVELDLDVDYFKEKILENKEIYKPK